jgi:hypothetical protein
MNTTNAVITNTNVGASFFMGKQEWVIVEFADFENKPAIKAQLNKSGIKGAITIRKPNGNKRYSAPVTLNGTVWEADIKRA